MFPEAEHQLLWFVYGLACGIVGVSIWWVAYMFTDLYRTMKETEKKIKEAKADGFELGRDWTISEDVYFDEIDRLWYEIEDLKAEIEDGRYELRSDGLYADGKPIILGGNDDV